MDALLKKPISITPLISFRVLFGILIFFSTIRFWYLGWIEKHFIEPVFHFKYFGFEWVEPLSPFLMYALHGILILASLGVVLGFLYRFSASLVFLIFTYLQLIDLTYYLNHYYFVSLMAFLMISAPANRLYALDNWIFKRKSDTVSFTWILVFKIQLAITYFYAGLAKINSEWLFEAMPLKIWLPPHYDMPILGFLMKYEATAYFFSWAGMFYDLLIPFALFYKKTRFFAYLAVVSFHVMTGYLFQIGVFPVVMIALTLIFFDEKYHIRFWKWLEKFFIKKDIPISLETKTISSFLLVALSIYFAFQILFPFRFMLYTQKPYNEILFWREEGYRFSWRVMLMEKSGSATFYIKNPQTGREGMVDNSEFLNRHQEKQMAFQPDMILQYAHFLESRYKTEENPKPIVRAEVYVTLNGRRSQLFFDPNLDLTKIKDSFKAKDWIYDLK